MVLENSSDGEPNSFTDTAPANDNDPYASSSSSSSPSRYNNYNIDIKKFFRPIPWPVGPDEQLFSKLLQAKIEYASKVLERPVNEDEATAFAYHTGKRLIMLSYGSPFGFILGLQKSAKGSKTFRFPFYQPDLEKFNAKVWPSSRLSILKGNRAVAAWQVLMVASYGSLGHFFGTLFFGNAAIIMGIVGEREDKRLKPYIDAVMAKRPQNTGGSRSGNTRRQERQKVQTSGGNTQSKMSEPVYGRTDSPAVDDASPTGGIFFDDTTEKTDIDGRVLSSQDNNGAKPPKQRAQWPRRPTPQTQPQEPNPYDAFDDAPPTGGSSQGSSWERLRRGETPAPPSNRRTNPPPQNTQGGWEKQRQESSASPEDSFSFSKADGDKSYAKEEAQREFDARVERERRGGDFAKGSGDQKRW